MEFLKSNFLNTTTMISVDSNTVTVSNLFNPNPLYQYYSDGFNNDLTTTSIVINFDTATNISRLALKDINLKEFNIFYNGLTSNSFALIDAATTTSQFITNSETDLYFRFSTLSVTQITIDAKKTIVSDEEKVIGNLYISDLIYSLSILPSASKYKIKKTPKQVVHTMSDGGTRVHKIAQKWNATIDLDNLELSDTQSLEEIYDMSDSFLFCPFGTTTSWDAVIFDSVWIGDYEFYEFSDNAVSAGFSGTIKLKETSA